MEALRKFTQMEEKSEIETITIPEAANDNETFAKIPKEFVFETANDNDISSVDLEKIAEIKERLVNNSQDENFEAPANNEEVQPFNVDTIELITGANSNEKRGGSRSQSKQTTASSPADTGSDEKTSGSGTNHTESHTSKKAPKKSGGFLWNILMVFGGMVALTINGVRLASEKILSYAGAKGSSSGKKAAAKPAGGGHGGGHH